PRNLLGSGDESLPGGHMSIKLVFLCAALTLVLVALCGSPADARDQCAGLLHQDGSQLWFGGAKGEGEDICIVEAAQVAKVLKTCSAGRYCRVVGTTPDC